MKFLNLKINRKIDVYEKYTIGCCLIFIIVLLILSHFHEIAGYPMETDFYGAYAYRAKALLDGSPIKWEDHGPGYFIALAIFCLLIGKMFTAGKLISIISAGLFIYFSYKTLSTLFDSKLSFFSIIILLILIFPFSILVSTDIFFAFLFSLSLFLIFRKNKITNSNLFWGAIIAGFAYMTRLNAIVLPMSVCFFIIFINPEKWNLNQKLKGISIFCFTLLLTASPWLIYNTLYRGSPFAAETYKTIGPSVISSETADGDFSWTEEKVMISQKYNSLLSFLIANLKSFFLYFLKNIPRHLRGLLHDLIHFPAYLFVAPGTIFLLSNIKKRQLSFLIFSFFGYLIYCTMRYSFDFFFYILPIFCFTIVYFLFNNEISTNKKFMAKFSLINKIAFIITITFLLKTSITSIKTKITTEPIELLEVAEVLKKECKESDVLIARKPHLGYFTNMKVVVIPNVNTIDELLSYADSTNASYLLYSSLEAETRSKLKILQTPEKLPPNFQLKYADDKTKTYAYKLILNPEK